MGWFKKALKFGAFLDPSGVAQTSALAGIKKSQLEGEQRSAMEANDLVRQQNLQQLMLQLASRGAPLRGIGVPDSIYGSESAVLPYYFGKKEKNLAADATALYTSIRKRLGSADIQLADYSDLVGNYSKQFEKQMKPVEELLTGKSAEESLSWLTPVAKKRNRSAKVSAFTSLERAAETLNGIDSNLAGRGFVGGGAGRNAKRFGVRLGAFGDASTSYAMSDLISKMDARDTMSRVRDRMVAGMNLPGQMLRSSIEFRQLPERALVQSFSNLIQPLSFFNIGSHPFQDEDPLTSTPSLSSLINSDIAQTGAAIGGSALKYYTNSRLNHQATDLDFGFKTNAGDTSGWKYLMKGGGKSGGGGGGGGYDPGVGSFDAPTVDYGGYA